MTERERYRLKHNPKAAADYQGVQDALAILAVLREAGIAKGDQTTLLDRNAIIGLRPSRRGLRPNPANLRTPRRIHNDRA